MIENREPFPDEVFYSLHIKLRDFTIAFDKVNSSLAAKNQYVKNLKTFVFTTYEYTGDAIDFKNFSNKELLAFSFLLRHINSFFFPLETAISSYYKPMTSEIRNKNIAFFAYEIYQSLRLGSEDSKGRDTLVDFIFLVHKYRKVPFYNVELESDSSSGHSFHLAHYRESAIALLHTLQTYVDTDVNNLGCNEFSLIANIAGFEIADYETLAEEIRSGVKYFLSITNPFVVDVLDKFPSTYRRIEN